jgi:alpha-tubulin suppressor-like RCC1 family protein
VERLALGNNHSCALLAGGAVTCWGRGDFGQLGHGDLQIRGDDPGEMGGALPAVDLGAGTKAVAIASTFDHVCALLEGGGVKCWGKNDRGQLGLGDKVHRGGQAGQMGDNLPAISLGTGAVVGELAVGDSFSCAVLEGGKIKCWGGNFSGQLGLGDTQDRGDDPTEMGDNLPFVDLGSTPL